MHVDKRNGDRTTKIYTVINIANLINSFLRGVGGNTAIETIDMNSNITKNVSNPLSNQDVATKNYVDTYACGVASGDIKLIVGSDFERSLGCNGLTTGNTSAGDRHKYAIIFHTRFRISSAYQDKN